MLPWSVASAWKVSAQQNQVNSSILVTAVDRCKLSTLNVSRHGFSRNWLRFPQRNAKSAIRHSYSISPLHRRKQQKKITQDLYLEYILIYSNDTLLICCCCYVCLLEVRFLLRNALTEGKRNCSISMMFFCIFLGASAAFAFLLFKR